MSRPRYWWYGNIKKEIQHYNTSVSNSLPAYKAQVKAIDKALVTTAEMKNGKERIKAITASLINGKSVEIVAYEMSYHPNVIQKWNNDFVALVAKYRGYEWKADYGKKAKKGRHN